MHWPLGRHILGLILFTACPSVVIGDNVGSSDFLPEEEELYVKPLSAHNVSALLLDRRRSGPIAIFFGSGMAATANEVDAFTEFSGSAKELHGVAHFGFLNCERWPDACISNNLRRTPVVILYPPNFRAPQFYTGHMEKRAISANVANLVVAYDRTVAISLESTKAFLTNMLKPLKVILFSNRKSTPLIFQALSNEPDLWPHIQFGFARDPHLDLLHEFKVTEIPAMVFQNGRNVSTRKAFTGNAMTFNTLRQWLINCVKDSVFDTEFIDEAVLTTSPTPNETPSSAPSNEHKPYTKSAYGVAACPPGQEITSVQECAIAIKSLGFKVEPRWVSMFPGLPRWCSVREGTSNEDVQRMHFNSAQTGQGREDLAVVCKNPQPKPVPPVPPMAPSTIPELSGQTYKELLGTEGFCLIYMKEGSITDAETHMLLSLEKQFRPVLEKQGTKLRWAWVNVYIESHLRTVFGMETLPSAVILNPHKQPRFAPVKHESNNGKMLPADEAGIKFLIETVLGGDARFNPVPAQKLMSWADRNASERQNKQGSAALPKTKQETPKKPRQKDTPAKSSFTDLKNRISSYEKMEDGAAGCPAGMEIKSAKECEQAIKSLGINAEPKWISSYSDVPKWCSVRATTTEEQPQRMHFNSAITGKAREDLAPVCKANPSRPNQTVTELTGKTYKEVLAQNALCLIYLREGPISHKEIEMLLSLKQQFAPQLGQKKLDWAWIDLRANRKLKKIFDAEIFPSAVVLDSSKEPRIALLNHEERDGEPLPAEKSNIITFLDTVLSGDAQFTSVHTQDLMMWADS